MQVHFGPGSSIARLPAIENSVEAIHDGPFERSNVPAGADRDREPGAVRELCKRYIRRGIKPLGSGSELRQATCLAEFRGRTPARKIEAPETAGQVDSVSAIHMRVAIEIEHARGG